MAKGQAKIFKSWGKIPTIPPCSIMLVTGKKMSNPNDTYTIDLEGNKRPVSQQGNLPYIITENNVYSISDLANLFEDALNKIEDKSTISIVIGIDN